VRARPGSRRKRDAFCKPPADRRIGSSRRQLGRRTVISATTTGSHGNCDSRISVGCATCLSAPSCRPLTPRSVARRARPGCLPSEPSKAGACCERGHSAHGLKRIEPPAARMARDSAHGRSGSITRRSDRKTIETNCRPGSSAGNHHRLRARRLPRRLPRRLSHNQRTVRNSKTRLNMMLPSVNGGVLRGRTREGWRLAGPSRPAPLWREFYPPCLPRPLWLV